VHLDPWLSVLDKAKDLVRQTEAKRVLCLALHYEYLSGQDGAEKPNK
jgi:hypothetical protein